MISTFITITIILLSISIAIWMFIKSSSWVPTTGTINHIEIIEKYNRPDTAMSENKKSFDYVIDLKYNYTINGTNYIGTKIYPGLPNVFTDKKDAENILKNYPANSSTTIYYDPAKPANSSLITSKSIPTKGIITLVVLVIFISLFVTAGILLFPKL